MIVVAIIGILAAIAIPSYIGYVARAQFSEAMALSSAAKTAVGDAFQSSETLAGLNNGVGSISSASAMAGTYVSRIEVEDGVITAHFRADSALADAVAVLQPRVIANKSLTWRCLTTAPARKAPSVCESLAEIPRAVTDSD